MSTYLMCRFAKPHVLAIDLLETRWRYRSLVHITVTANVVPQSLVNDTTQMEDQGHWSC